MTAPNHIVGGITLTGNLRTETMAFFFFIAMGVFMQLLMEQGFWTSYNRAFGTMKHLYSEFRKSDDLLEVEYIGHKGSDRVAGKGFVIEAEEKKAILVKGGKFFNLDAKDFVIEKVIPTHTGRQYFYKNLTFINVDLDSLNMLCLDKLVAKIEVHSNQAFIPWTDDFSTTAATKFKGEHYSNLFFEEKATEPTDLATYRHVTNPRIKLLKDKLARLKNQQAKAQLKGTLHQKKLDQLRQQSKSATDYLKIEQQLTQIKELEKVPKTKDYSDQLEATKIQIAELTELDKLKRVEGNIVATEKNKDVKDEPARFTGFLTTLTLGE